MLQRRHLREESYYVNMTIFIVLRDLHAKLPGLTMLDFFCHLDKKVWKIWKHDSLVSN